MNDEAAMPLSDDDLILYFYGESENAAEIAARLAASAEDRARYAVLERTLRAADEWRAPDPLSGYGNRVWRRLEARIAPPARSSGWRSTPRLAWAAAAIAAVGLAFYLGRAVPERPVTPPAATAFSEDSRERILQAALAHHLERAERLLAEIDNGGATLSADLGRERSSAANWVEENRIYRQAAAESGLTAARPLLDELEPLMLELAHAPASAAEVSPLRERLAKSDLLFKVRILSDRLQRETQSSPAPRRRGDVL
jgi:hypothetical protein